MDKASEIKRLLKEIVGDNGNYPFTAIVTAVNGNTCTVKINEDLLVPGVRLKATTDNDDNYLLITPKIGSRVLMLSATGTMENLTVIQVDEIAKIEIIQSGLQVLIDSKDKKVSVKNEQISLVDLFSKMTEILKGLKVFTNVGPSGTPLPDTVLKIEEFETQFKQLLK